MFHYQGEPFTTAQVIYVLVLLSILIAIHIPLEIRGRMKWEKIRMEHVAESARSCCPTWCLCAWRCFCSLNASEVILPQQPEDHVYEIDVRQILEHCVCTYLQSLLRRISAGELKEITDCDTSFSWKCYVNVFLTRRGTPLVSHNKKPAKRSQPSVNQVLWWFCMWILWSSPRPMHPVSWLEASWFWCGEKGEGPPNNASFYS